MRVMKRKKELTVENATTQEELDLLRAKERAGLKHKKGSVWERKMKLLSKKLPDAKEALISYNEERIKLMNDTKGQISESEDDESNKILDYIIDTGESNLTKQEKLNLRNNPWLTDEIKKEKTLQIEEIDNDPKLRFKKLVSIECNTDDEFNSNDELYQDDKKLHNLLVLDEENIFSELDNELILSKDENLSQVIDNKKEEEKMRDLVDAFGENIIGKEFAIEMENENLELNKQELNKNLPGWGSWTSSASLNGKKLTAKQLRDKRREKNKKLKKDLREPLVIINKEKLDNKDNFRVIKILILIIFR